MASSKGKNHKIASRKARRALNSSDFGNKISGRLANRAGWGAGLSPKDGSKKEDELEEKPLD